MSLVDRIFTSFSISDDEYKVLEKKYGDLCHFISWQLLKQNNNETYVEGFDDINQDLLISIWRAACYQKRQVYIEECFHVVKKYIQDPFLRKIVRQLRHLWKNKTRHGANRQKFGEFQESILDQIVSSVVPENKRPSKKQNLKVNSDFGKYCKQIAWNCKKNLGKKFTKEKSIQNNTVSLSEHEFLL